MLVLVVIELVAVFGNTELLSCSYYMMSDAEQYFHGIPLVLGKQKKPDSRQEGTY